MYLILKSKNEKEKIIFILTFSVVRTIFNQNKIFILKQNFNLANFSYYSPKNTLIQ